MELILRLAAAADIVAIPEVLALVRDHGGRATNTKRNNHARAAASFNAFADSTGDARLRSRARRRAAELLVRAAADSITHGDYRSGARQIVQSAQQQPLAAISTVASALWRRLHPPAILRKPSTTTQHS
jgi:hypothetical protein